MITTLIQSVNMLINIILDPILNDKIPFMSKRILNSVIAIRNDYGVSYVEIKGGYIVNMTISTEHYNENLSNLPVCFSGLQFRYLRILPILRLDDLHLITPNMNSLDTLVLQIQSIAFYRTEFD